MSREEFNKIVDNFTKILYKSYSLKRSIDNRGLEIHSKVLFLLGFILLIIGFSLFYWGVLMNSRLSKWISLCMAVLSLISSLYPIASYYKGRINHFPTLDEIVGENTDKYTRELNNGMMPRGLFWNVVPGYFWAELHIDRLILK